MSNYTNLKNAIQSVIKANGNNEITGPILQSELLSMIITLGAGYQYMGVAQPSTNPGTPDARVMYLAYLPGTYVNFGGLTVTGLCVLRYDTSWTKEDIPISGGGGSANFLTEPDDLTLETVGNTQVLKFANRQYNNNTPNGLGYKILRGDSTFAEQVTDANTIYEIRYDFNLNGGEFAMPSGCVLHFVGGSIANGTITTNPFRIVADNDISIFKQITFNGSYITNNTIYVDWFDCVADGVTDNFNQFKRIEGVINLRGGCRVVFGHKKTYAVKTILSYITNVYLRDNQCAFRFKGCKLLDINLNHCTIKLLASNTPVSVMFEFDNCADAKVHDGFLIGDRQTHDFTAYTNYAGEQSTSFEWNYGIQQKGGFLELYNLNVKDFVGDNVCVGSGVVSSSESYNGQYIIHDCEFSFCGRNAITGHSAIGVNAIIRTHIHDVGYDSIPSFNPKAGIDFEFEDGLGNRPYMYISECVFERCSRRAISVAASNTIFNAFVLENSTIIDCALVINNLKNSLQYCQPVIENCRMETTTESTAEINGHHLSGCVLRGCQFVGLQQIAVNPVRYENCNISTTSDSSKIISNSVFPQGVSNITPEIIDCTFEVNCGFMQFYNQKQIKNSRFVFGDNVTNIRMASCEFFNCEFKTSDSVAVSRTMTNIGLGDVSFIGCKIKWNGSGTASISGYSFNQKLRFVGCVIESTYFNARAEQMFFDNCKLMDCYVVITGSLNGENHFDNCSFYNCRGNNAGGQVNYSNCKMFSDAEISHANVLGINGYNGALYSKFYNCHIIASGFTNNTYNCHCLYYSCVLDIANAYMNGSEMYNTIWLSTINNNATKFINGTFIKDGVVIPAKSGTTADRPTAPIAGVGSQYFDTDLGKMIVSNGTNWVNMDGSALN